MWLVYLETRSYVSDESVVEQWNANAYYQHFCGAIHFTPSVPCNSTEFVHVRKHIGKKEIELILRKNLT